MESKNCSLSGVKILLEASRHRQDHGSMDITYNDSDKVSRLQRAMGDLVAFSSLPAAWVGLGSDGIAKSLAQVLLSTLDLDLVYIQLAQPGGSGFTETVSSKHRPDANHCISEDRKSTRLNSSHG